MTCSHHSSSRTVKSWSTFKAARAICLPEIGPALLQHIVSWRKAILVEIFHQKKVEKLFYTYFQIKCKYIICCGAMGGGCFGWQGSYYK